MNPPSSKPNAIRYISRLHVHIPDKMWKICHFSEYQVGASHTTFLGQNFVGNPKKESKIQNLEPFSHFQPFFAQKSQKWLIFKIGATNLKTSILSNLRVLNLNLMLLFEYFQNLSLFSAIFCKNESKMANF